MRPMTLTNSDKVAFVDDEDYFYLSLLFSFTNSRKIM